MNQQYPTRSSYIYELCCSSFFPSSSSSTDEALIVLSPETELLIRERVDIAMKTLRTWAKQVHDEYSVGPMRNHVLSQQSLLGTSALVNALNRDMNAAIDNSGRTNPRLRFYIPRNRIEFHPKFRLLMTAHYSPILHSMDIRVSGYLRYIMVTNETDLRRLIVQFHEDMYTMLSHEWIHLEQRLARPLFPTEIRNRPADAYKSLARRGSPTDTMKYYATPEEIMARASGHALRYRRIQNIRNSDVRSEEMNRWMVDMRTVFNEVIYGSPAFKLFMRYFIESMQHNGFSSVYINRLLVPIINRRPSLSLTTTLNPPIGLPNGGLPDSLP